MREAQLVQIQRRVAAAKASAEDAPAVEAPAVEAPAMVNRQLLHLVGRVVSTTSPQNLTAV